MYFRSWFDTSPWTEYQHRTVDHDRSPWGIEGQNGDLQKAPLFQLITTRWMSTFTSGILISY